ncbi:MAG: hypothetical protein OHK0023_03150 [Anaerolineae bacterium]
MRLHEYREMRRMVITRKLATCPTCHHRGVFERLGEQRWPAAIARQLNLPEVITLWSCSNCATTVSEMSLEDAVDVLPTEDDNLPGDSQEPSNYVPISA